MMVGCFGYMRVRFNPCFNGYMGKDLHRDSIAGSGILCFNPCFNGYMGKDPHAGDSFDVHVGGFQSLF